MTISTSPGVPSIGVPSIGERFARLHTSARDWLADLEANPGDVQRHLDSPIARALLQESEVPEAVSGECGAAGPGRPVAELRLLEGCRTQEEFCGVIARSNDSTVDLREVVPHIRRAGLSRSEKDSSLVKNLGFCLVRSGRWRRVRPGVYRLRDGL